jgi:phosphorylcholine metabolism protein LicD
MDDLENLITIDNTISSDQIFEHLCFITNLLEINNIKYWIAYGTLLGSIRQNDIIPYDYDFDLGIFYEDHIKVLELNTLINDKRYKLEKGTGTVYGYLNTKVCEYKWRVSIKVLYDNEPVADLYIYQRFEDGLLRRYDKEEMIYFWPNSTFPYAFIEEMSSSEIRGKQFPCPRFPEVLLEHFYGPLWKIPIKAMSQNGEGHVDYDYYGSYKYTELSYLVDFVKKEFGFEIVPNLDVKIVKYYFPLEQKEWVKNNEILD